MNLRINGQELPVYPARLQVTVLDLDDADSTERTADGILTRSRVAVKRQIEMEWNALRWEDISAILQMMADIFFSVTYPDPMTGQHETKTMYVGNRVSPVAIEKNGVLWWEGLQITLTEQ